MAILLTGADGYLGWPTLLKLARTLRGERITAVDDFSRRRWVEEVGGASGLPILPMRARIDAVRRTAGCPVEFVELDLTEYAAVKALISDRRPDTVIHAAAQPSAPFAEQSASHASLTQQSNTEMTLNLLWALRESGLHGTHYVETTTTGIYGTPGFEVPEGDIEAEGPDGRRDRIPYPNMAHSWYHVSKGFNAVNMRLMHAQTGMPVSDVRTSIIYGTHTAETAERPEFENRFDFDRYFGTVLNRWIVMAILGMPLRLHGSGTQLKPFIHVEDAAGTLAEIALRRGDKGYRIYNQLTEYVMIREIIPLIEEGMRRHGVAVETAAIPNPRREPEGRDCRFRNHAFLGLLTQKPRTMRESIGGMIERLLPHKELLERYRERI